MIDSCIDIRYHDLIHHYHKYYHQYQLYIVYKLPSLNISNTASTPGSQSLLSSCVPDTFNYRRLFL